MGKAPHGRKRPSLAARDGRTGPIRHGSNWVGIEDVAEAAGITKRTLHAHFDSKDRLVAEVLEAQHVLSLERIARWAEGLEGSPEEIIGSVFE